MVCRARRAHVWFWGIGAAGCRMPSEECVMTTVGREELDGVPVWVREGGFPGELCEGDLAAARRLF